MPNAFIRVTARVKRGPSPMVVEVPAAYLQGKGGATIQYYLTALDRTGGELVSDGNAVQPYTFNAAPDPLAVATLATGTPIRPVRRLVRLRGVCLQQCRERPTPSAP